MQTITKIICPNCGNPSAERHNITERQISRTQCPECDYLLVMCQRSNRTIEAYAPGIDVRKFTQAVLVRNSPVVDGLNSPRIDRESDREPSTPTGTSPVIVVR